VNLNGRYIYEDEKLTFDLSALNNFVTKNRQFVCRIKELDNNGVRVSSKWKSCTQLILNDFRYIEITPITDINILDHHYIIEIHNVKTPPGSQHMSIYLKNYIGSIIL